MNKRYWVFAYDDYYPSGGMTDLQRIADKGVLLISMIISHYQDDEDVKICPVTGMYCSDEQPDLCLDYGCWKQAKHATNDED